MSEGVLTAQSFVTIYKTLSIIRTKDEILRGFALHPMTARQIDWYAHRPTVRAAYRAAGFPFGRNQGSFKRWALLVGRYPWPSH